LYNPGGEEGLVEIRRMEYYDIAAADLVAQAAFQTHGSRADDLRSYLCVQPDGWLVAEENGSIAGLVGAIDYGPFAWVGVMVVLPELQGRGIGRKLLERTLEWLDARRCPLVRLDATPAGQRLYPKLGFAEAGRTHQYLLSPQLPAECESSRVHAMECSELEEVIEFDETVFGARREKVLRLLWDKYPGRRFVSHDERGRVTGYLFAQRQRIGPWLAITAEHGKILFAAAGALRYDGEVRIIVPEENEEAGLLLNEAGCVLRAAHSHMIRGKGSLPGMRRHIWSQASYALG